MRIRLSDKWVALAVFLVIAVLFLVPIFSRMTNWGSQDWDQQFFYRGAARKTIMDYGQLPLWNPWHCGGTPLLANTQSAQLSPMFLLVLAFGAPVGMKLSILLHMAIGMWGMWLLARRMRFSTQGAYASALIFMLSSWFALKIVAGHVLFFYMSLVPYVMLCMMKGLKDWRYLMLAGLLLTVQLFSGAIYMIFFTPILVVMFSIVLALRKRSWRPLLMILVIFFAFALTSAVKLLPMTAFLMEHSNPREDIQYYDGRTLFDSYLSRNQGMYSQDQMFYHTREEAGSLIEARIRGEVPWGWHEYGAYIGYVVLALVLVSFLWWRRVWDLLAMMLIFLWLGVGDYAALNLFKIFSVFPFLSTLHGPSRMSIMVIFFAALLAGFTVSRLSRLKQGKTVAWILVGVIILDLGTVGLVVLKDAFPTEAVEVRDNEEFFHLMVSDPFSTQYVNMLQNIGTLNCYERVHPEVRAIALANDEGELNPAYKGEAYLLRQDAKPEVEFSPNRFTVEVTSGTEDTLVLNQNYDQGWYSDAGKVIEVEGKVGVRLEPGEHSVRFRYLPATFIIGAVISILSIMGVMLLWRRR